VAMPSPTSAAPLRRAAATGVLVLGARAGAETPHPPMPDAPHGQLLQAPDGTLYLLVAGQAHPITSAPLADEALAVLTAGEALPDGAFWLVPAAAPSGPAQAATLYPWVAPFFATQTAVAPAVANAPRHGSTTSSVTGFFATQTAVAPRGSGSTQRAAATATARAASQRSAHPAPPRVIPAPNGQPLGQS
jgi:hypothetical protein